MHTVHHYAATILTCRYTVPEALASQSAKAALRDAFLTALAYTVLEHPLLQVGQVNVDSARASWAELDTVDLNDHIDWITVKAGTDYEALLRETTQYHLDAQFVSLETKPGWRLAVLQREDDLHALDVVLAWHHANFDGTGAKIFHKTLLRNMNRKTEDAHDDEEEINWVKPGVIKLESVAQRFVPRPTQLGKFTWSKRWALAFSWKELKPPMFQKHSQFNASWAPICESPLSTQSRLLFVKSQDLGGLLKACRAHKTTLTGLVMALAVVSLATQSKKDKKLNGVELEGLLSHTALDLRRHLPAKSKKYPWIVPDNLVSNIVSIAMHEYGSNLVQRIRDAANNATSDEQLLGHVEEYIWTIASQTRQEIEERLELGLHNEVLGLMHLVPDWRAEHKSHMKKPRGAGMLVTNLGVLDGGDRNDTQSWGIDQARFQLSAGVTTPSFQVSAISVKGGDLCLNFAWQDGVVPNDMGDQLMSDVESWIGALSKEATEIPALNA